MLVEIKMPALSPTMEKGTIAKWLVAEGDIVAAGDLLAEIETDKATMEFEATDEGRITKILIAEGTDDVGVGAVIALIGDGVDVMPRSADAGKTRETTTDVAPRHASMATTATLVPRQGIIGQPTPSLDEANVGVPRARFAEKVKISPLAARIADAKALDLSGIVGSGPGGRIVRADLYARSAVPVTQTPRGEHATSPQPVSEAASYSLPDIPYESVRLSTMRKTIARRLTESKQTIPHIYLTVDIELEALLQLRTSLNASLADRKIKLTLNDLMIKALAIALTEVPECNVQFAGDQMLRFSRADISVAVSMENGLVTPVIRDAGRVSLSKISTEMKDLATRARDGRLRPEEYEGGTASLSNLGMFGIDRFQAVINPPQAMIMAVGSANRRPIIRSDQIATPQCLTATGSFDHRAIDGADAARFMKLFKVVVEEPTLLLA